MHVSVKGIFLGLLALTGGAIAQTIPNPSPVNRTQLNRWVTSHCTEDGRWAAQWIAKNIRHVSYQEFQGQLRETVQDFEGAIGDEPFAVVVPRPRHSEEWVTSQAIKMLTKAPFKFIDKSVEAVREVAKWVKHFVIFDDAIYSGSQMGSSVGTLVRALSTSNFNPANFTIHIAVPFIRKLSREVTAAAENMRVAVHSKMASVGELIKNSTSDMQKILYRVLPDFEPLRGAKPYLGRVLTYFDHKIADHYSLYGGDIFRSGYKGNEEIECKNRWERFRFIPPIFTRRIYENSRSEL